jgi:hypothetical protein
MLRRGLLDPLWTTSHRVKGFLRLRRKSALLAELDVPPGDRVELAQRHPIGIIAPVFRVT